MGSPTASIPAAYVSRTASNTDPGHRWRQPHGGVEGAGTTEPEPTVSFGALVTTSNPGRATTSAASWSSGQMRIPVNFDSRFGVAESSCRDPENRCGSKHPTDEWRVDAMCGQQGNERRDDKALSGERDDECSEAASSAASRAGPVRDHPRCERQDDRVRQEKRSDDRNKSLNDASNAPGSSNMLLQSARPSVRLSRASENRRAHPYGDCDGDQPAVRVATEGVPG